MLSCVVLDKLQPLRSSLHGTLSTEQSLNRANDVEFTRRFHVLEEKQLAALHRTHDNKLHISYNLSYQRLDDTLALTDNWFTGSRYDRCIINSEKCRFSTNKPFDF